MAESDKDETDKSHEPTAQKLKKAREKGDIPRSTDVAVAASYCGFLIAASAYGGESLRSIGTSFVRLLDGSGRNSIRLNEPAARFDQTEELLFAFTAIIPWFALPALAVMAAIFSQRAFVFVPSKLQPKVSRISLIANARNKFGRQGLYEFAKSAAKLVLYSVFLVAFLQSNVSLILSAVQFEAAASTSLIGKLCVEFILLVLLIAIFLAVIDVAWQHMNHLRKNRMSRKELLDENKDSEGDPHFKQHRRQRGQEIAMSQMMAAVPTADVVVVNPTHYAVALKWSRLPGSAPICVAKGVDAIAASIRKAANEAGVPIHNDPQTARTLHATVDLGQEISEDLYRAVAAAIRFAEEMRKRARGSIY